MDNKRFHGNVFVLLREAEDFVLRHMSIAARFEPGKMRRIDEPTYPPKAVREAIINAISHRDYTLVGGSVTVSIYDDRLEVISHGKLPKGITVSDLSKKHESKPRNELIANTLFRRGVIESVGTGTQEMIKYCQELGLQEPEFLEEGDTFSVIFKAKEPEQTLRMIDQTKKHEQLTARQNEIINLLRENETLSASDIIAKLAQPSSERTLRRDLLALKKLGIIDSSGHAWTAIWFLKIR